MHDLSFMSRREETTRNLVLGAFFVLSLAAAVITLIAARLAWKGWTLDLRRALLGQGTREFQPLVRDVRALVVGGRVVAAMQRQAPLGQFRANLHRGGSARAFAPDLAVEAAALAATAALGLDVAGVDLLLTASGPLVLEVNASPGLEGIEAASGVDVAGAIIALAEERATGAGSGAPTAPFRSSRGSTPR